jgi:flavin reductase
MARLGAAVNIITTDGPAGRSGMTASAVVSVTDEPLTLAVCINRSSCNNEIMKINGVLAVNTLCSGQREVSNAGRLGAGARSLPIAGRDYCCN